MKYVKSKFEFYIELRRDYLDKRNSCSIFFMKFKFRIRITQHAYDEFNSLLFYLNLLLKAKIYKKLNCI